MKRSVYVITILTYAFFGICSTPIFADNNNESSESLHISCPTEKNIYMCEPVTVPQPLELKDFTSTLDDQVAFEVKETLSHYRKYTVTQYEYSFTDTKEGSQVNCMQKYYIPNASIQPPTLAKTINICEGNSFTLIDKPYEDNYYFYADNRGTVGKLLSSCQNSDIWCLASDLGLNITKAATYKFWVTNVIKERSSDGDVGFWCESEAVEISMKVKPKPTAVLKSDDPVIMKMGEFINLMDMVEENLTGSWKGKDIFSFKSVTKYQYFYYFPQRAGLHKLYYTVDNGACQNTYTMIIEVFSARKSADASNIKDFTVFPNPSKGNAFVNLSNSVNVEHTISVFDIFGKQHISLAANDVRNTIFELDLHRLPKGAYIVEVRNPFSSSSKKLIVD